MKEDRAEDDEDGIEPATGGGVMKNEKDETFSRHKLRRALGKRTEGWVFCNLLTLNGPFDFLFPSAQLRAVDVCEMSGKKISSRAFYEEYHGHRIEHLEILRDSFKERPKVWLIGDSSLDSKYYQPPAVNEALNGYEAILEPALMRRDVCYWLNSELSGDYSVINCAVEESTLSARVNGSLLPQDEFAMNNISAEDVLVCSVGGNDVALRPSISTILACLKAIYLHEQLGLSHFESMFKDDTISYLNKVISKTKPKLVIVSMIYFPDENTNAQSWASTTLGYLRYNSHPAKLQSFIRRVYECATSKIQLEGVPVIPCALYEAMDGKNSEEYVARVEPSELGAHSLAKLIKSKISNQ